MINAPLPSFDRLVSLAQNDPERFARLRADIAEANINSAPPHLRARLRGLQFTIDGTLRSAKNPVAGCVRLSQLLHDSFDELQQVLTCPQRYIDKTRHHSAEITPLHRPQNDASR